ncbi:MAG: branched-chain amino acid transaminase, partial [Pseudomonadota bacterium]
CREVVRANGFQSAYLRPIAFRGHGALGVVPGAETPTEVSIAAIPWGAYLGEEGREKGVDVCVSSWNRLAPNTIPAGVKAGGNYLSSQLISGEAKRRGYAEGIGLAQDGTLSEGAGENLFIVREGKIYTPPAGSSILSGFTRDTVKKLAATMGIEFIEQIMPREMMYIADEIFFTGTAAEITPIRSVDDIPVRCGGRGPVTKQLQDLFFGLFAGTTPDQWGWLEPIYDDQLKESQPHGATAVSL